MSVYSGPKIPNNGLILCLDASNRKSFAGVGTERLNGIAASFNNWNGLVGTSSNYTATDGRQGVYLRITASNGGGVNWWNSINGTQPCSASTQYIITAKIKYSGATPNPNLFYVRQYNSSGAQTSESGKYSSSTQVAVGNDGYYLAWAYFTTDSTAASFLVQGYDYQNIEIRLEDVQCKLAGLADLSGNNNNGNLIGTMGRSSANAGVIQLSGSNYIATGLNLSSGAYTVVAASRYVAIGGRIITAGSNNWLMGHWAGTTENHYAEGWVSAVSAGVSDTNWRILAATGNTTTDSWQMYVNGGLTYSNANGSAGPNNLGINIYSERSNSEVGVLLAYNRVLSAGEVAQNFQALRGRFGI
jgi:hypothetical protein